MSRPFKIRVTYEGKEWSLVVLKRPEENRWFLGLRQAYNVAVDMGARSLSWGAFYKRLASNSKAVMCQASSFERGILIRAGALDLRAPSASLVSAASLAVALRDVSALPAALGAALTGLVSGTTPIHQLEEEPLVRKSALFGHD
jgi:hypothetical protein